MSHLWGDSSLVFWLLIGCPEAAAVLLQKVWLELGSLTSRLLAGVQTDYLLEATLGWSHNFHVDQSLYLGSDVGLIDSLDPSAGDPYPWCP